MAALLWVVWYTDDCFAQKVPMIMDEWLKHKGSLSRRIGVSRGSVSDGDHIR